MSSVGLSRVDHPRPHPHPHPHQHPRAESDDDSDSRDEDEDEDEGWSDAAEEDIDNDEEETPEVISLLDDRVFPDVVSMLLHCRERHGFDFLGVRQRLQLDFHGCVQLVNFIRQRVHEGLPVTEDISWPDINHDQYLKPVLDDDAVILGLFDLPEVKPAGVAVSQGGDNAVIVEDLLKRNSELQGELTRVKARFDNYRVAVQKTLDERWGDVDPAEQPAESATKVRGKQNEAEKEEDESKYYWESYAGADIHEEMLKDTVRTDAYRDFIYNNKHLFAGKTVLDIGCGTGILSMFCARAGASRVFAVDASAIISKAQENVFHNGLSSVITCVSGRIEDVVLPVDEVDVIVSEWMGYCLLFEAMLPSVLWARNRYLKPGGLLVPSHANLWLAPVADPQYVADNVTFWRDVYGFDMRSMQAGIYDDARVLRWSSSTQNENSSDGSEGDDDGIAGSPIAFKLLDLYQTTTEDLSFTAPFASSIARDVDALDGFLIWFDIFFSPSLRGSSGSTNTAISLTSAAGPWACADPQNRVAFTTGPHGAPTHWKQGLLLAKPERGPKEPAGGRSKPGPETTDAADKEKPTTTALKKGYQVKGDITFSVPEDHARGLSVKVSWNDKREQTWALR
ncbi:Ribosomal protein arginine N-methyltransferase rmt3 [Parahypoxylon ruwenzoriense]